MVFLTDYIQIIWVYVSPLKLKHRQMKQEKYSELPVLVVTVKTYVLNVL